MAFTLSDEVRKVLSESEITDSQVKLPGQLSRELYLAVNKALTDAGGKWNRKAGAHVFVRDPREVLGLAIASGVSVNKRKERQEFVTPAALAKYVVEMAGVDGHTVLEPSAGTGSLAKACMAAGAKEVICVELDSFNAGELLKAGFDAYCTDFLQFVPGETYKRIVMNPPFTRNQDVVHVSKALALLAPHEGQLTAIMMANTDRGPFRRMVEDLDESGWWHESMDLPEGSFKEAGTGVHTMLFRVRSPAEPDRRPDEKSGQGGSDAQPGVGCAGRPGRGVRITV